MSALFGLLALPSMGLGGAMPRLPDELDLRACALPSSLWSLSAEVVWLLFGWPTEGMVGPAVEGEEIRKKNTPQHYFKSKKHAHPGHCNGAVSDWTRCSFGLWGEMVTDRYCAHCWVWPSPKRGYCWSWNHSPPTVITQNKTKNCMRQKHSLLCLDV